MAKKKRKAAKDKGGGKYGPKAQSKVKRAMKERKDGTRRSGGSGEKVTRLKQAIASGLSEARRAGAKVRATLDTSSCRRRSGRGLSCRGPRCVLFSHGAGTYQLRSCAFRIGRRFETPASACGSSGPAKQGCPTPR